MDPRLRERVGNLCAQARWQEAIDAAGDVDSDYDILWSKGWALYKLSRLSEALQCLDAALAIAPESSRPVAYWARGVVLNEQGDHAGAESSFRRAINLRDGYLPRQQLAALLLRQGRGDEAEAVLREGIHLRPRSRRRLEAYADLLSDLGRDDEAEYFYAQAANLPER